jgi:lysophospholipase L1-like esterase
MRRPPPTLLRIGLVVFGLLLALLVAEVLLQVGARAVRVRSDAVGARLAAGRRVICLGDSNTYGLFLPRAQAFPAVLQRRWDADGDLPPIEVLNLGVPGTNSSKLRVRLPEILDAFQADVVLLMIGVNDAWTVPVPIGQAAPPSLLQRLWSGSRVFRLLYMGARAIANRRETVAVEFTPPGVPGARGHVRVGDQDIDLTFTERTSRPPAEWKRALRDNLIAMRGEVTAAGAVPILLTYPSSEQLYGQANEVIRAVAAETGTPLIDVAAALQDACRTSRCDDLFLRDLHASASGNEIVAATVFAHLKGPDDVVPLVEADSPTHAVPRAPAPSGTPVR